MNKNTNINSKITEKFCQIFESGTPIQFKLGWFTNPSSNAVSNYIYKGIYNKMILAAATEENEYKHSNWMTFNQAKSLGGNLKNAKGKGINIGVMGKFSKKIINKNKKGDEEEKTVSSWFIKTHTVFNIDEINELPEEFLEKIKKDIPNKNFKSDTNIEKIISKMNNPPKIKHGGEKAYYHASTDTVQIPHPEKFKNSGEYYSALFHELIHSTLHKSRLNRKPDKFGSKGYAEEELIAVLGSAMAADIAEVEFDFHGWADYMRKYVPNLKSNPTLLFKVSSKAEKAVKYIFEKETIKIKHEIVA